MTKEQFLADVSPYNDHLPLLWLALQQTDGSVGEFGSGHGSTPFLKQYCLDEGREFFTYDNNKEWCDKTGSKYTEWGNPEIYRNYSVCLIDHAPGEHRHKALAILKDRVKILVVHDSEPNGSGNYMLDKIWSLFKYRVNCRLIEGAGAEATALSNSIDMNEWIGFQESGFKIE